MLESTMDAQAARARRVNLIEVLRDEAAADGVEVDAPPEAEESWSEQKIRAFFSRACTVGAEPAGAEAQRTSQVPVFKLPDAETFARWFPSHAGLLKQVTQSADGGNPKLRLLCLHSSGNAEDMYTSQGTGSRRAPSPLLEWCAAEGVEVLAAQAPGRGMRLKEAVITSAQELASALLQVVGHKLQDSHVPYAIISHSMGCWVAFELLQLARNAGLPMPHAWCLSAMPAPDIPEGQRPWRRQALLDEQQFKEECRGWDVNEVVFSNGMWQVYQPLLRADFTVFDSYTFCHEGQPPLDGVQMRAFWGTRDRRVTAAMVQEWSKWTSGLFQATAVEGNHLWPLSPTDKIPWLRAIVACLDGVLCK